jgi:hypothetical protein
MITMRTLAVDEHLKTFYDRKLMFDGFSRGKIVLKVVEICDGVLHTRDAARLSLFIPSDLARSFYSIYCKKPITDCSSRHHGIESVNQKI